MVRLVHEQRLAAPLDAPPKDAHWPVTDMPARVGGIDNNRIIAAQIAQRDAGIRRVAADWAHIHLTAFQQRLQFLLGHCLDLVSILRSLVIAVYLPALIGRA